MTLPELCEPLFQYICFLNRSGRKGQSGTLTLSHVRARIETLLDDANARATREGRLLEQYRKVELPLIFFVDSLIATSNLPFAQEWKERRLAYEKEIRVGDDMFFDLLEDTLAETDRRDEEANERLAIFYTCLGLGFTGAYEGDTKHLRRKMLELADRLRRSNLLDTDVTARLVPRADYHVDARTLWAGPAKSLVGMAIALAVFVLVLFAVNIVLFQDATRGLMDSLEAIMKLDPAPEVATEGTSEPGTVPDEGAREETRADEQADGTAADPAPETQADAEEPSGAADKGK